MNRTDGRHAIHQLANCHRHAIAYGCTASGILQGHAFEARPREEIGAYRRGAGDPQTAMSPYPKAVDAAEHRFFAKGGVDTIAGAHPGQRAVRARLE